MVKALIYFLIADIAEWSSHSSLTPFNPPSSPPSDGENSHPKHTRRPFSRARPESESVIDPRFNAAASKPTTSTIPFFDKENPARFLAILKGVSARVDKNAEMRADDVAGPACSVAKIKRKRPQMTSVGHSPVAKRVRGGSSANGHGDNGEDERPSTLQKLRGYHSLPNVTSQDGISPLANESRARHLLLHELPQISPTLSPKSQDPPPHPAATQIPELHDSRRDSLSLHPLLQKAPSEPLFVTRTCDSSPQVAMTPSLANSAPVTSITPSPGSTTYRISTPCTSGKSSARPPILGMRRTRTLPSGPQNGLDLPTRQKGFRPPLLSGRSQQPK